MNQVKVRPMVSADKPAVMEILKATTEFKSFEVDVAEELIDCFLKDPEGSGYFTLVAEVGSEIEGYTTFGPTPLTMCTWDVYWMAVRRNVQGHGIGKSLINVLEDKIRQSNGKLILIETSSTPPYDRACTFYTGRGYKQICTITDFYAPGDSLIIFEKRL